MSKVMLVEDDDSLREIYSIRLTAEGYTIVSARDGEEALAVAVRERPDLIVSDVMMPKISGFDVLDILRSTPETQNIKVIMMTALSTEDQRLRGEALGADRYLVKSQVGIEDVVNAVHEVLGDRGTNGVISTSVPQSNAPISSPEMFNIPEIKMPEVVEQTPAAGQPAAVAVASVTPQAQPVVAAAPVQVAQPAVAQTIPTVAPLVQPTAPAQAPQVQPQPSFDVASFNIPPQSATTGVSGATMTTGQ